ncbi:MAG: formylglycine-generating enzyme family protein [Nitrospira sp. SB0672_bin_25]|nr:formylglycine-generating enzyme family protein [Nitrospira sp. SB0678_bin_10]MYJ54074.1 formylglycine-generating enzyme family protein [Nitrospira sp. SB0672_bin_25]
MRTTLTLACVILSLCFCGMAVSQDLPDDILADQYLLEAKKALENGQPQTARQAFEKIEALDTEPPLEFYFFFGKLLVEHGTTVDDARQGQASLKQFVVNIEKSSEYYRPTLELLSAAGKKIEKTEQRRAEEAKRQAAAQERAATLKDSLPLLLKNLQQQMVVVPGGTFTMGCTEEQSSCDEDEKPVRQVQVKSFTIGKYEVTQDLWEAVMGKNPSKFRNCPRCPVEHVGWDDTKMFLKKLNALTGGHYRLPTDAEWEYAARGGQKNQAFLYVGSDDLGSVAWYDKNSGHRVHRVGQKQPNALGLYDMSGNVWEWLEDCWGKKFPGPPADGSAWKSGNCARHMMRGGAWTSYPRYLRSSNRYWNLSAFLRYDVGFRLVATP